MKSSSHPESTDSLDSFSLTICPYRSYLLAGVRFVRMHASLRCSANIGVYISGNQQEEFADDFVTDFPPVASMSCSFYLHGLWDGR